MTMQLKDVLEAVLVDLIEARHAANEFSMSISPRYTDSGDLSAFPAPSLDIGNVKVDIRFAIKPPAEEAGEEEDVRPESDQVLGSVRKSTLDALNKNIPNIAGDRERSMLSMRLTNAMTASMDPETLTIDRKQASLQARRVLDRHVEARNIRRVDEAELDAAVERMVDEAEQRARQAAKEARQKRERKGVFVVDSQELNQLDPATVSTLSLDLDLASLEWASKSDE